MSSVDIYAILESKPNNPHHLKRYYKFILACRQANESLDPSIYTEDHHICPKARDLFPEYIEFGAYPWNKVELTARQHIVAHIILWKAYGGSQAVAAHYMLNVCNSETNPKSLGNRKIPKSIDVRYSAIARDEYNKSRCGKATFKDAEGNSYYLECDDPRIKELGLVGKTKGHNHSDDAKEKMSAVKFKNKKVTLKLLDCRKKIWLFDDKYQAYLDQGWLPYLCNEDREYIKELSSTKTSSTAKGNCKFMYEDGTYYGVLKVYDPLVDQLGLVPYITDKGREQQTNRQKLAVEANTGTNIYNNGVDEARFREDPGGEWKLGRIPRSEEWSRKQKAATSKKNCKFWNNGVECRLLKKGEPVPDGWVPGMLKQGPRKKRSK